MYVLESSLGSVVSKETMSTNAVSSFSNYVLTVHVFLHVMYYVHVFVCMHVQKRNQRPLPCMYCVVHIHVCVPLSQGVQHSAV